MEPTDKLVGDTVVWGWWALLTVTAMVQIAYAAQLRIAADATDSSTRKGSRSGAQGDPAKTSNMVNHVDRDSHALVMRRAAVAYTLLTSIRSILPRVDVERVCMLDVFLSWPLVGRSAATVAELALVVQLARTLQRISGDLQALGGGRVAASGWGFRAVSLCCGAAVPLIIAAEALSWVGVLTTRNVMHGFEESLWAAVVASFVPCAAFLLREMGVRVPDTPAARSATRDARRFLLVLTVAGAAFVAFMVLVDVPMYFTRWAAAEARGDAQYLGLWAGLFDAAQCKVVSRSLAEWREEMPWMSGYFVGAVSASLWLARAPRALLPSSKAEPARESERSTSAPVAPTGAARRRRASRG